MALVFADRVLETCSAPGTGSVSLLGATTGYRTFSAAVGNANTCYYTIADQSGANWEVGLGTYATAGNTLARTTVLSSSNSGSLVNFSSGTQNVFLDYPASVATPLESPTFTGTPAAPTATVGTNTTQIATTAYVVAGFGGLTTTNTYTAQNTFSGSSSAIAVVLPNAAETTTVSATAATGTINIDFSTQSVLYYTTAASANWVVNFRHSSGTSLNTAMAIGQTITMTFMVTNGATARYNTSVQVDGTTTGVTTRWQGGTAPTAGDASAVDVYTYAIIKTANATFSVFAAISKFA